VSPAAHELSLTGLGHYIENTGSEDLVWIEIYKSDRMADISLGQWLALTPHDVVASILKIPIDVVDQVRRREGDCSALLTCVQIKKVKQLLIAAS
jgi:oxalate decarboxylase/phosphoglucose isomerase-like protein (cupin superfamily)